MTFLPYLNGERIGGSVNARAQFFGITAAHTPAHFFRAVMEGVAFASRRNLDLIRIAGESPERLILCGGGAKGSPWPQVKASIYNLPLDVPENPEGWLVGCAMLAAVGTNTLPDFATAVQRMLRMGHTFLPDPQAVDQYARQFELYEALYRSSAAHYDFFDDSD